MSERDRRVEKLRRAMVDEANAHGTIIDLGIDGYAVIAAMAKHIVRLEDAIAELAERPDGKEPT